MIAGYARCVGGATVFDFAFTVRGTISDSIVKTSYNVRFFLGS